MNPSLNSNTTCSSSDSDTDETIDNASENINDESVDIRVNEIFDLFDAKCPMNLLNNGDAVISTLVKGLQSVHKVIYYKAIFLLIQLVSNCNNDNVIITAIIDAGFAAAIINFLNIENVQTKHIALKLIKIISENKDEGILWLLDSNFIANLLNLFSSSDKLVVTFTATIAQNIIMYAEINHQFWIDCDLISYIKHLLIFPDDDIKIAAMRIIKESLSDNENYPKLLMDAGVIPRVLELLKCVSNENFEVAVEDITDFIHKCTPEDIVRLIDADIIPLLINALETKTPVIIFYILISLQKLLKEASNRTLEICKKIKKYGGVDKIGSLLNYPTIHVSVAANDIISTYFSSEYHDDNDIIFPEVDFDEMYGKGIRINTRAHLRQHQHGQRRWKYFQQRYRWL